MCPLSLHESIWGSVMTKRSGGRVQLSRNLSQLLHPKQCSVPTSNRISHSSDIRKVSLLTSDPIVAKVLSVHYRRSACSHLRFRSAHWLDALTQVGKLRVRCLLVLFLVLSLHSQSVMCKRWLEQPKHITFKSKLCRPVSQEDLKSRMGKNFDERQMATDSVNAKRKFGDTRGYQGDDPYAGYDMDEMDMLDQESLLSSGELWLREEEIYADESMFDGVSKKKDEFELDLSVKDEERKGEKENSKDKDYRGNNKRTHEVRRTWLPRRRILGSHRRDEGRQYGSSNTKKIDSSNYMRRRRRRRSALLGTDPRAPRPDFKDSNQKDMSNDEGSRKNKLSTSKTLKKSSDVNLSLKLILSGRKRSNRKLRKQLKKEFRQRARKQNKPPPWQCKFRHLTVFMGEGIFPRVLRDGRCMTDKCFYRLYNCEPIKYAIKLLYRDPDYCNPLPLEGNGTVYEESWNLISRHIVVGCNCASLADSSRSKSRRKN